MTRLKRLTGQPQGIAPTNSDVGAIPCGCPALQRGNESAKILCNLAQLT